MKKFLAMIIYDLCLFVSQGVYAQNLVPNPGFENYNNCPSGLGGVSHNPASFTYVQDWITPSLNATADYYNVCATNAVVHVPLNGYGYQQPHGGNAYTGMAVWRGTRSSNTQSWDENARCYIECKLSQPMLAGHQYCVSMYLSPAYRDGYNGGVEFDREWVGIDSIGVNFSDTMQHASNAYPNTLKIPYSIMNTAGNYLNDTNKWYKIQGIYTATGAEQWLTIGSFPSTYSINDSPAFVYIAHTSFNFNVFYISYYYFDDISVVEISNSSNVHVHDTIICKGSALTISGDSTSSNFLWSTGDTTQQITVNTTGTYWCMASINCQSKTDTFHIAYYPATGTFTHDTMLCDHHHNPALLISSEAIAGPYKWNTGATTQQITIDSPGTYWCHADSSACGIYSDIFHVTFHLPDSTFTLGPDLKICDTVPVVLSPDHNYPNDAYLWSTNETSKSISVTQSGLYILTIENVCDTLKDSISINFGTPVPKVNLGGPYTVCRGDFSLIIGHEINGVTYSWNRKGDTGCCVLGYSPGLYILTVSNSCGSSSDTTTVSLSDCDSCIYVPNAFTPYNHDGINDIFKPIITCPVQNYVFRIYNGWGQKIFETTNPEKGWNGHVDESIFSSPAGHNVYVYYILYTSSTTESKHMIKGNVTLIK